MTATTMATKSVRVFNREQDIIIVHRFVRRVHANVRCVKECRLGSCRFMSHVNMWQARSHTFFLECDALGARAVRDPACDHTRAVTSVIISLRDVRRRVCAMTSYAAANVL